MQIAAGLTTFVILAVAAGNPDLNKPSGLQPAALRGRVKDPGFGEWPVDEPTVRSGHVFAEYKDSTNQTAWSNSTVPTCGNHCLLALYSTVSPVGHYRTVHPRTGAMGSTQP